MTAPINIDWHYDADADVARIGQPTSRRDQLVAALADFAIAVLKAAPAVLEVELERRGYTRPTDQVGDPQ